MRCELALLTAALGFGTLQAQKAPTLPTNPGRTSGIPTTGSLPTNNPNNPNNPNNNNFPNNSNNNGLGVTQRPVFLSGKVVLQDGTPPPEPVRIEKICGGNPRPQGYTDSKGRFSFQLDSGFGVESEASDSNPRSFGMPQSSVSRSNSMGTRDLTGCDIRASLPGFQSSSVNLGMRQAMDNPEVGTLILTRLGNVDGTTISMTSLNAPKDALKAFTKGRELLKKEKLDDAQREFQKAVDSYPKYASAWQQLGLLQLSKEPTEAEKSFTNSLEADPKFISPYLELTVLLERRLKWQEALDLSNKVIHLNATDFPQAYFFAAVAQYNLHDLAGAEKNTRETIRLDTRHQLAKAEHLLGTLLAQKGDVAGATEHMRSYLQFSPNASDTAEVQKQLASLEKQAVAEKAR